MYGPEFFSSSLWWICPILMIAMCFFMMRGRRGSMMCGFGSRDKDRHHISTSILQRIYSISGMLLARLTRRNLRRKKEP